MSISVKAVPVDQKSNGKPVVAVNAARAKVASSAIPRVAGASKIPVKAAAIKSAQPKVQARSSAIRAAGAQSSKVAAKVIEKPTAELISDAEALKVKVDAMLADLKAFLNKS